MVGFIISPMLRHRGVSVWNFPKIAEHKFNASSLTRELRVIKPLNCTLSILLFVFYTIYFFGFCLRLASLACYLGCSVCMTFCLVLHLSPVSHQSWLHISYSLNHPMFPDLHFLLGVPSLPVSWRRIILSDFCIIIFIDFFFHLPRGLGSISITFNWTNYTSVAFGK